MGRFYFLPCRQEILGVGNTWSNMRSNWNSDNGYSDSSHTNIPWNIKSTGFWSSVEFVLAQKNSLNGCSSKHGFTVEYDTSYYNDICTELC